MQHWVGYTRVSTDEQGDSGLGLDAQHNTITNEAERRGWSLEFRQDIATGKHVNPGLRAALDLLATGQADGLVIAKMDRIARSALRAMTIIETAKEQGWALLVLDIHRHEHPSRAGDGRHARRVRGVRAGGHVPTHQRRPRRPQGTRPAHRPTAPRPG